MGVIIFKMSDDQKKTIALGIGIGALVVGAYVAYKYYWEAPAHPMLEELKIAKLTEVKRNAKGGKLEHQYFLSLLQFVGAETRKRTKDLRSSCQEQRRRHFRANEDAAYKAVVKKVMDGEDQTAQDVVK